MHKLIIHKLGPIRHCELQCTQFMTLTGFQASGKSTIAKAVYYFRTIKDDIIELAREQALNSKDTDSFENELGLDRRLENHLREKFLRTFGSSWGMEKEMFLEYCFTDELSVKISLVEDERYGTPNYIWVTICDELRQFLRKKNHYLSVTTLGIPEEELKKFKTEIYGLFRDEDTVVYIPAGRSMITLLSQQLGYIYATMDEMQKRSLDNCTKDYLERILRLKPEFSEGLQGLALYPGAKTFLSPDTVKQALNLIKKILRGTYRYSNGEEQIVLEDGKYVKINYSSSGQQECVWILNLLFYHLIQQKRTLFIVEEPESHLFPESQKYISELIALVVKMGHSVLLTTHSPYVLGTLNNLLYAGTLAPKYQDDADKIISKLFWIEHDKFDSWFVEDGTIENCMDREIQMIQNERIDEISKVINADFDMLLELQSSAQEAGVTIC